MDKDLEKYLYGGDDGKDRKKNDLDDELDSYWDDSAINANKQDVVGDEQKEEQIVEDKAENDKKENDDEDKDDDVNEKGL